MNTIAVKIFLFSSFMALAAFAKDTTKTVGTNVPIKHTANSDGDNETGALAERSNKSKISTNNALLVSFVLHRISEFSSDPSHSSLQNPAHMTTLSDKEIETYAVVDMRSLNMELETIQKTQINGTMSTNDQTLLMEAIGTAEQIIFSLQAIKNPKELGISSSFLNDADAKIRAVKEKYIKQIESQK